MKLLGTVLFIAAFLALSSPAQGIDQKESLRGLTALRIVVENLHPELERAGLSKEAVKDLVEKRLRRLGVKVSDKAKPPAMSTLYITLTTLFNKPRTLLVYGINIMLYEYAYLKRDIGSVGDLKEVNAINWYKGAVGYLGQPFAPALLKKIDEMVNLFITDYLAVNPG